MPPRKPVTETPFLSSLFLGILCILLALFGCSSKVPAQSPPLSGYIESPVTRDIMPALRPNDSVKVVDRLPWVSVYTPPPAYLKWWKEVAACEKLVLPTELIATERWIQVNSNTFHRATVIEQFYGYAATDRNTIVMAVGSMLEESKVKHEMAHQLNAWNGVDEGPDFHPYDTFEVCGLHINYP